MPVAERLERVYRLAQATGHLARFVVFVRDGQTGTPRCGRVSRDEDAFDAGTLPSEAALVFEPAADAPFGASVFWVRRLAAFGGEQTAVEYWQVKREGGRRGTVEISQEMP